MTTATTPGIAPESGGYTVDVIERTDNRMVLSMGPQHPSTHGVLQVITEIQGENITKASPEIGYLHTGIEKSAENLFWNQASTVIERMDYLSPLTNALCYYLAVEKLLGIDAQIPPRANQVRVLLRELSRIASHCVWLGTGGIDIGALTPFFYCFDLRERILDLFEDVGRRAHAPQLHPRRRPARGSARGLSRPSSTTVIAMFEPRMRDLRGLLQKNPIFQDRTIDIGIISRRRRGRVEPHRAGAARERDRVRRAQGVPVLAATASTSSTCRCAPKATRTRVSWCGSTRWTSRCASSAKCARSSTRKVRCRSRDTKFAPPPKETIALSMEALIHHFKLVSESFRVPPGDVYQAVEGPRGELGYYVVSNGDNRPWRVRTRPPSMYNLQVLKKLAVGELIADMVVMIGSLDPVFGEVDR